MTFSSPTDQTFTLIKSLTKAEKRNFKLYATRIQSKEELKFVRLFEVMDKMTDYHEADMLKRLPEVKRRQLPNLKRHLYKQILSSLRIIHIQKNADIEIREQIDFARILYGKGLYLQSLKLLERIKGLAIENHLDLLLLEILEFQKLIEERHITRSRQIKGKVENLLEEAAQRSEIIRNSCHLSNLKIKIHGWYIQIGHVKNEKDRLVVEEYFRSNIPKVRVELLTFFEKIYYFQSNVWYHYIMLDFESCYTSAKEWVDLFQLDPKMQSEDPDLYMRGLHYLLTSAFNLQDKIRFAQGLNLFESFYQKHHKSFPTITQTMAFLYLDTARLNALFLEGTFEKGLPLVPKILKQIKLYEKYLDPHRIMVFYYKFAFLYIGCGRYKEAIDYLNIIIDLKIGHLREDIQSYARLLFIIAHFELGHYDLMEYLLSSTQRYLEKLSELNKVQKRTLKFFRQLLKHPHSKWSEIFVQFRDQLKILQEDPYEMRAFLYLDILTWAQSKVEKKSLAQVIRNRNLR